MTQVYFKVDLNDDAHISFFPFTNDTLLYNKGFTLEEKKEKNQTIYLTYTKNF